jgi:hypothetical protein
MRKDKLINIITRLLSVDKIRMLFNNKIMYYALNNYKIIGLIYKSSLIILFFSIFIFMFYNF